MGERGGSRVTLSRKVAVEEDLQEALEEQEAQAQTHTGRVIYCNEDLWRQIQELGYRSRPGPQQGFPWRTRATIQTRRCIPRHTNTASQGILHRRARMDPRDTAIIHKDYPPCSTHRVRREGGEGPIWPLNWPGIFVSSSRIRPTKSACETVRIRSLRS